ncbi:helix-turn-helix domain-containing protein [Fulvimarina sp. MAC3]|uniref:helix-turn-helix domain-containing protein n=1 Tax=Fulvimarina sp. MAC3 TaxID=3148887 RepID=UPI0031FC784E
MVVEITRSDHSPAALRSAAAKSSAAKAARRMLAIALILEGVGRRSAAQTCGMDRQTLRDWVHRYNKDRLKGLSNRFYAGPSSRLGPRQKAELAKIVREGPIPSVLSALP